MTEPTLTLTTQPELSSSGDGVARDETGRVVFIEGAAPDERVLVRVIKAKKTFVRAQVDSVVEPSAERIEPVCPHFGFCGGCATQHVSLVAQVRSKQKAALDQLSRIGKIDVDRLEVEPAWSGAGFGYRTRARFSVAPGGVVGYRARRGHEVVDVGECPILAPPLQRALALVREAEVDGEEVHEVSVVASGDVAMIEVPSGVRLEAPKDESIRVVPEDDPIALEHDDGFGPILIAPSVFTQSNAAGNTALLEQLDAWLSELAPASVIELYAGSGNLTRLLARAAKSVRAIEGDPTAAELAGEVLPAHVEARIGDVKEALEGQPVDLIVADPPRSGLGEGIVDSAAEMAAALFYISCDPSTFARDAARLRERGLELRRVRLFDFYPQTPHAEVLGWFSR